MSSDAKDTAPRVGVVTVAYGSDAVLPGFLASLPDAVGESFVTVVADNRPGPESQAAELARTHGAQYLALPDNPGYGGAINAATQLLPPSVDWVVISNPDVVFSARSISTLVATGALDDTIGAVGPAVENLDGTVYPSARPIPTLRTGIGHALFADVWRSNPWTAAYRDDATLAGVRRDVGWLSGSCLAVRRSAFEQVGGFDDGYFMYFEDVDLGHRLGKAGFRSVYEPAARAVHTGAHSTDAESGYMVRAHHDSAKRFVRSAYRAWYLRPVRTLLVVGLSIRSVIMSRAARKRSS
jgi:N-acetylglucosaminyl-diphospho-decaprenol L-rhamnosyltransferase